MNTDLSTMYVCVVSTECASIKKKKLMVGFLNNFAWSMQPAQTEELQRDTKFDKHTYCLICVESLLKFMKKNKSSGYLHFIL